MVSEDGEMIGTVAAIWRYPVKALAGEPLESVRVFADGLEGDRTSALVVRAGHARVGKTYRGKEHRLLHTLRESDEALAAAHRDGIELERRDGGRHFDLRSVSLIVDRWIAEVEHDVSRTLEPLRFRPNFFVGAAPRFTADEGALTGTLLALGGVRLRVVEPIRRCVTPTYDLATGEPDPRIGAAVANGRANIVGIYCEVETAGSAHLGDIVTIVH